MSRSMTHDQKETCIEFVRAEGTLKAGAKAAGVSYQTIRNEIKKSPLFQRRIAEAQIDGKSEIGDKAVENIKNLASETNVDVRSRLTANMSLANWAVPGFRGESRVSGKIEHSIRVNTAIPRPNYKELPDAKIIEGEIKELPSAKTESPVTKKRKKNKITEEDKEKLRIINKG